MAVTKPAGTWRYEDLFDLPDDGRRYEIIDGELYVSKQPSYEHQYVCTEVAAVLRDWSVRARTGRPIFAPGLIFASDEDEAPDVVWVSDERLAQILGSDRKLHGAPELVVEVLSPGAINERRDREAKLKLYSRRGVLEYWIVDWRQRQVEVYRRQELALRLVATLYEKDELQSPILPGFTCDLRRLFPTAP